LKLDERKENCTSPPLVMRAARRDIRIRRIHVNLQQKRADGFDWEKKGRNTSHREKPILPRDISTAGVFGKKKGPIQSRKRNLGPGKKKRRAVWSARSPGRANSDDLRLRARQTLTNASGKTTVHRQDLDSTGIAHVQLGKELVTQATQGAVLLS